ncbi:MAG TPA: N-acetylmannosamine-6-phosphate 2-epimerase [Aggregatilinea sp.]|uniref:N-acetylmannosamine-6-phosphate 2-epimerase n=1 Tax=Aggregatilinea sp. TaxID=2806333 RepID=UPI002BD0E2F9|nr:N-acetylmannosamine-6-phosphate 2-epimerase [Aggregatilinea sp.]HML21451.1 N-acetylmannosamine-6-phosphate 2-epimerase [Aggregatilinea sp.]
MSEYTDLFERLRGQLIVSCQALDDEPLHGSIHMAAMARAALMGGAGGIRANGPDDIAAIKQAVPLPVIGIYKQHFPGIEIYITATFDLARAVVEAGADLVALDASDRARPGGITLPDLIARIHGELGVPVMADTSCMEDARFAQAAGADLIGSTLAGYTAHGRPMTPGPDLDYLRALVAEMDRPVIAEGRYHTPEDAAAALRLGAHAVVVGGAITRPQEITRRFIQAISG